MAAGELSIVPKLTLNEVSSVNSKGSKVELEEQVGELEGRKVVKKKGDCEAWCALIGLGCLLAAVAFIVPARVTGNPYLLIPGCIFAVSSVVFLAAAGGCSGYVYYPGHVHVGLGGHHHHHGHGRRWGVHG